MAPRRSPKSGSPSPGARREAKHGGNKSAKKEGVSGTSFFTWFMVIALLGVWTSVAVVWFELVDYEEVLAKAKDFRYNLSEVLQGKLGIYDADGDGDFDMEDAKVLLGLTKDGKNENIDSLEEVLNILAEESSDWFYGFLSFLYDVITPFEIIEEEENDATDDVDGVKPGEIIKSKVKGLKERTVSEQPIPRSAEEVIPPKEKPHVKTEHIHVKTEPEDEIEALLHELLDSQPENGEIDEEKNEIQKDEIDEDHEETDFQEEEEKEDNNEVSEEPTTEQSYDKEIENKIPEISEKSSTTQEEPASHYQPKDQEEYDTDVLNDYSHVEEDTNEPEIQESGPENTEQSDHVEEEELEREDFTENTETIDHPEEIHERDADVSDAVTEPVQSVHEEEHTEEHVAAQHHDTEVPVHTEDYIEDDVIDT